MSDQTGIKLSELLQGDDPRETKERQGLVFIVGQDGSDYYWIGPAQSAGQMAAAYCAAWATLASERRIPLLDPRKVWVKDYQQSVGYPLAHISIEDAKAGKIARLYAGTPAKARALNSTIASMEPLT